MKTDRDEVVRIATIMQRLGTYPMVPPDILLARAKDGGDLILELLAEKEAADTRINVLLDNLQAMRPKLIAAEAARDASQEALKVAAHFMGNAGANMDYYPEITEALLAACKETGK